MQARPCLSGHKQGCPRSHGLGPYLHSPSSEPGNCLRKPWLRSPGTAIRAGEQKGSGPGRPVSTEERSKGDAEIRRKGPSGGGPDPQDDKAFNLEDFNPLSLGRRSRRIFDDVWTQFAKLSSPLGSQLDNELDAQRLAGSPLDGGSAQTATTRVLVVGATGRVGRVLIRKLVLRGYAVSALVRNAAANDLPQSVRIIEGDVNDYASCRRAVQGVDKVVYCAGARSSLLMEEKKVSEDGVQRVASAFQDAKNQAANRSRSKAAPPKTAKLLVAAKQMFTQWKVTGLEEASEDDSWGSGQAVKKWARPARQRNSATAYINHRQSLIFEGSLPVRNAHATIGCDLEQPPGKPLLANCEGLTMRVASDGQPYWLELSTEAGHTYSTRFSASSAFTNVRLPFNVFRPQRGAPPQWDPADASHISIRRDARPPDTVLGGPSGAVETNSLEAGAFHLEVLRIKALPGGTESDFVLVSCAAAGKAHSQDLLAGGEGVGAIKRAGEAGLRRTGLGYTIVRPAELIEEPGGYKALLFDQGNRIRSSISCVDVADVCMRALHNPAARNKTFELAHETPAPLGMGSYELVAHLPDKANDYLGPALSNMERNL